MKIEQQAIEEIQNQFKCIGIDYTNNKDVTAIAVAHGEMAEAVIQALNKQIPKKPKPGIAVAWCPECGMIVGTSGGHTQRYCDECGQRIRWD